MYYQGIPSLTFSISQKYVPNVKVQSIENEEIYKLVQENIRGGVSQVCYRYKKVEKEGHYILYLDVNALYSKCLSEDLPYCFVEERHDDKWNYLGQDEMAFVECSLHYPSPLHSDHFDLPLCPHKYNAKLCTTFLDKDNILLLDETLNFYISKGLIVKSISRYFVFKKAPLFAKYVTENVNFRKKANSKIEQDLFKLLNNSLYGKTCENVFKYKKVRVVHQDKLSIYADKLTNIMPISEELYLMSMPLRKYKLNKPIQIGFAVLEKAKIKLYDFFYILKKKFKNDMKLLYTDTDSLMLWFENQIVHPYVTMIRDNSIKPYLDFENAPDDAPFKTNGTLKEMGLWSDETNFQPILEYCGLRAKCYCYRLENDEEIVKNKGILPSALKETDKKEITMQDYIDVLMEEKQIYVYQNMINVDMKAGGLIYNSQRKLALSVEDDKHIKDDNDYFNLIPFGYKHGSVADSEDENEEDSMQS